MNGDIELCLPDDLPSFRWPAGAEYERAYLEPILRGDSRDYIANVRTELALLRIGRTIFPLTVNDAEYDNSYVCSPYNGAVSYPLEELRNLDGRTLRWSLAGLIGSIAPLLRLARVNAVVSVNNWMLSTNLYPAWRGDGLPEITKLLCTRFAGHAIMFRSLNRSTNDRLCERFQQAGYLLAPSRQVYMFDGETPDYLRRPNSRWDRRLLETSGYSVVAHDELSDADDRRIRRLYELLYLDKYSQHNPQFTEQLIRLWRERRLLKMFGLRSGEGRLDGIVGCFARGDVLTAPLVGYDTSLPQRLGLYRMLMALVLQLAADDAVPLNLSSGAAHFKRLRGGQPQIEYTAIYCHHLPRLRRTVWRTLAMLLEKVGAGVLKKYQL